MEAEIQPKAPHENGAKVEDTKAEIAEESKSTEKEETKAAKTKSPPATRSRSRTPQITKDGKTEDSKPKKEDKKHASPSLKKIDEEINGHSEKKSKSPENKEKKTMEKFKNKEENPVEVVAENATKNNDRTGGETVETKEIKRTSPRKREKHDETEKKGVKKSETDVVEAETAVKNNETHRIDGEDMDPLILGGDEPDPELQFDETSDLESGKGSPVQMRCKTRRSHTRNIPTPKTPKSVDSDSDKNSVAPTPDPLDSEITRPENLNDTNDSLNVEDISTRVEVGSDVTRLDYITHNDSLTAEDQAYLANIRERSLRDTLRQLSPRRPIHSSGSDSYRVRAFRNNQAKAGTATINDSLDRIIGMKRKRSITPEDRKKFKAESPAIGNFLSSPLRGFSSRFMPDSNSSTPKLTGYKDENKDIHEDFTGPVGGDATDKKNWCTVM